jgi:hypothetical protein
MHENYQPKHSSKYATKQFASKSLEEPIRRYQRLPVFINQQLSGGTKLISEKVPMQYESRKEVDARVVAVL